MNNPHNPWSKTNPVVFTIDECFTMLEEDLEMLASGDWQPDADSVAASMDVLAHLRERVEALTVKESSND